MPAMGKYEFTNNTTNPGNNISSNGLFFRSSSKGRLLLPANCLLE